VAQFKYLHDIVVLQMAINGDRMDMNGRYIGTKDHGPKAGLFEVEVNTIRIHVEPSRVVDAQAYWNEKNKKGNV
jgi:hypothetical protein